MLSAANRKRSGRISTNEKLVVAHRRSQNESWVSHLYRAGSDIEFTSIGVRLSLEALYEHVTFQQRPRKAHRRKAGEQ